MKLSEDTRLIDLSKAIEAELVAENPRGMASVRPALDAGYLLRAAQCLLTSKGPVAIITGFPVAGEMETDGPAGAIALYEALDSMGRAPEIWIEAHWINRLFPGYRTHPLEDIKTRKTTAPPAAILVIERPGASGDGRCYNISGADITDHCLCLEQRLRDFDCPLIAIGDGGNEIGMGKASNALNGLPIKPAVSSCDELLVADVSNWAGYALAMVTQYINGGDIVIPDVALLLERLAHAGAVDGVSGKPTPTEDGFTTAQTRQLLTTIQHLLTDHATAGWGGTAS